jgi:hypothetical protein
MKYGLNEDSRLAAAALMRGVASSGSLYNFRVSSPRISRSGSGFGIGSIRGNIGSRLGSSYGSNEYRRREDYVPSNSNKPSRRNFFQRAGSFLREYVGTAGKLGFVSMFPIGFAAGFGGTFLYDSGKFAYDAALYLINSFPNYSFADVFKGAWNYVASVPLDALVAGIKDGVVAGLGGSLISSYIKRKIFGR